MYCDLAIAGAGLAGGLIALASAARWPDRNLLLLDAADRAGGNHIWSFFDSDVTDAGRELLAPLVVHRWDAGYEVRFPAYTRTIATPYNSITSDRLDACLRDVLGGRLMLRAPIARLGDTEIELADGRRIEAGAVIDARGFMPDFATNRGTISHDRHLNPCDPTAYLPAGRYSVAGPAPSGAGLLFGNEPIAGLRCGWQKFAGQTLRLSHAHGLSRPIVMDATVEQLDGYRFVYVLPLGPDRLFVEDTYYSETPDVDLATIRHRIGEHAQMQGWNVAAVEHEETGVLPVVKDGDFTRFWPPDDAVARAGVRAGLFHPTTGYSLPFATDFALWFAQGADVDGRALARMTRDYAARHWHAGAYYRLLDTMLFDAAPPSARYRIFERFYHLSSPLIARFYSGRSSTADKLRILCGRPPVRIRAAMQAILNRKRA